MSKDFLPSGWVSRTLEDVVEINPRLDKKLFSDDMDISFVPMSAVETENGKIDISEIRSFGDVKKGYTAFQEKDVLFAKITPCMENGKMAVVPKLKNNLGFGSTEFHVLRSLTDVLPEYIYYFVSSKQFRIDAEHNMTGAVGQRRVPTTYFQNVSIPLPEYAEQKRVVAKIEELFSELDSGIASLKTAQEQLKIYRQALLKHAFEGKLTEQWRKDNASKLETPEQLLARIQTEREARYQQQLDEWKQAVKDWEAKGKEGKKPNVIKKLKDFGELDNNVLQSLNELPSSWYWGKVGSLATSVEYGTSAKSSEAGKVPVIRMGNMQGGKIDWSDLVYTSDEEEIEKYRLSKNDVLFNRTNSPEWVGKTVKYSGERPAIFAGYLIRINYVENIVNPDYLNYFLNSQIAKNYGNTVKTDGVNQSNINGEKLQHYPFPFCSLAEQQEIVNQLEEKLSIIEQNEKEIESALAKAELLRQSILKKAFSGQLVS